MTAHNHHNNDGTWDNHPCDCDNPELVREVQNRVRPWQCPQCAWRCTHARVLVNHINAAHPQLVSEIFKR